MSSIDLPTTLQSKKIDTYTRTSGPDTVHMQSVVIANPLSESTGTLSAVNAAVTVTDLIDMDGVLVTTAGTFSGTLAFEASNDGTNWYSIWMSRASGTTQESSRALTGATLEAWRSNIAGWSRFRVRCSAYTSGTAAIFVRPVTSSFEGPAGSVTATLAAGTALAADVGVGARATTTNAVLRQKIISAASTNATSVKASAGRIYGWSLTNTTASVKYVKIYNKASAPTVGTDVPVETIAIPPNANVQRADSIGVFNSTGIALAITGGVADADTTAVAAGDVVGSLYYA